MTVRTELLATLGLLVLLLVGPALFAAGRLAELRDLAVEGRGGHASAALVLGRMEAAVSELDRVTRSFVAAPNAVLRDAVLAAEARLDGQLRTLMDSRYGRPATLLAPSVREIGATTGRIVELVDAGELGAASETVPRQDSLLDLTGAGILAVADSVDAIAQQDFERARAISQSARTTTLATLAMALVAAALLAGWTTRRLTHPLRRLADATTRVASGSFEVDASLPVEREDEIGELSRAFSSMTQRLRELDRMKAEFLSVATHQLKTPINVIGGYAELMEEEMEGEVPGGKPEIFRRIQEQTRALTRLVNRLMDISRLEAGTYRLDREEVHTEDLVTGLVRGVEILAKEKDIDLTFRIDPSTPETLLVDAPVLQEDVLGNLVSNALKHTPEGGSVEVAAWGDGDDVVFQVRDSGPGIPPEHRKHIFRKYYQVDDASRIGMGLGLALAREMTDAHDGTIELVEEEGEEAGATFRVTIPARGGGGREPRIDLGREEGREEGSLNREGDHG